MTETSAEVYDRGVAAGQILERLAGHDRHFADINGHLATLAIEAHSQTLQLQRLADAAEADRQTTIKTAAALKEAEEARRDQSTTRWTPFARLIAVLGAAGAAISTITYLLATRH
jgi:hypothetical protein